MHNNSNVPVKMAINSIILLAIKSTKVLLSEKCIKCVFAENQTKYLPVGSEK